MRSRTSRPSRAELEEKVSEFESLVGQARKLTEEALIEGGAFIDSAGTLNPTEEQIEAARTEMEDDLARRDAQK